MQGSPDLYKPSGRSPATSVNFITCHDGFTLADLVSFNHKHNDANGEHNRDGGDDNHSWNCGAEGWSDDPAILGLRQRQMMNAFAILLTSRGVPMFVMGDEFGRSQHGNNNAYCLDSPLTWVNWELLQSNHSLHQFVAALIAFRHQHPALRQNLFDPPPSANGLPAVSFHGPTPWSPDWSESSRQLGWMFSCDHPDAPGETDTVYVIANMAHYATWFDLPALPEERAWQFVFNTGDVNSAIIPSGQTLSSHGVLVGERSVMIFTA